MPPNGFYRSRPYNFAQMDTLLMYISLIEPRLLRHVTGKPGQFITTLREETYLNEEAFQTRICGPKNSPSYYRTLKSRTLKIVQALAIISAQKGGSMVKKNFDKMSKYFLMGQKILSSGERMEGLRLIKQAYKIAATFDFVYQACELSSILYHDHVYYHRDEKRANFYAKQVNAYLNDYTAEKNAEHHFYQVLLKMSRAANPAPVQEAIRQVELMPGRSIKYHIYTATLHILYGFHHGDYPLIIRRCSEALKKFEGKKGVYASHYYVLYKTTGIAHMALGQYDAAKNSLEKSAQHAPQKSLNDYIIRFYQTLNALHSGDYQTAYDLFRQNKRCRFKPIRRQFAIIEAYLYVLARTGHLKLNKRFRLGKYLNDTFAAQRDKKGDHINILIAELLVHLVRDRDAFIDRILAIKHYSYRHLNTPDTRRAKAFLKILCTLPRANFHPKALDRLAKKSIDILSTNTFRLGDNFAVEIIPFSHLLSIITEQLNRKVA